MAETQELDDLKRRGRRRLIGAVALVLVAVIVLPMVFDEAPRQAPPSVSVRIPGEDEKPFTPKPVPKPAAPAPATEATPVEARPGSEPAAAAPAAAARPAPAPAADSATPQYVIPVIALANSDKVKEVTAQIAKAKIPHYTERVDTASGPVTRVRAGPFRDRKAAEEAVAKLKRLGLNPGKIATRTE